MKRLVFAAALVVAGLFFVPATASAQSYVRQFNYNTGQWILVPYGSPVYTNPPGFSTPGYPYPPNYGDWRSYAPGSYRNPGISSQGNHGYRGPQGGWTGRQQVMPQHMPMQRYQGMPMQRYQYVPRGGARYNLYRQR